MDGAVGSREIPAGRAWPWASPWDAQGAGRDNGRKLLISDSPRSLTTFASFISLYFPPFTTPVQ